MLGQLFPGPAEFRLCVAVSVWTASHTCVLRVFKGGCGCVLFRAQELCESRGGSPWLPIHKKPYGFCGTMRKRRIVFCLQVVMAKTFMLAGFQRLNKISLKPNLISIGLFTFMPVTSFDDLSIKDIPDIEKIK